MIIQRERVADNVYSFQSDAYAQVNAGAVIGPDWAVAIDTLAFPEETLEIRDFIEQELKVPVRYVINTHYHADHCWGTCFFPGAIVISHQLTRNLLEEKGIPSLDRSKKGNLSFRKSRIVLPQMTFSEGRISLRVGKKTLSMMHLPGHSEDGTGVLIEEDRVMFSGDILMPVPYIVDGDPDQMKESLLTIRGMGLENIVQGHGDVILRGEVEDTVDDHIKYLEVLEKSTKKASRRKFPGDLFETMDVESCGKSRVLLGGLAEQLHQRNLAELFERTYEREAIKSPKEDDYF